MAINTQIPREEWKDFFATFSNGNRARPVTMEVFDTSSGSSGPMKLGPLMGVDYDPVDKGNDIILSIGMDNVDRTHTIDAPTEVRQAQLDNGEIFALEIVDQAGSKTVVSLGES